MRKSPFRELAKAADDYRKNIKIQPKKKKSIVIKEKITLPDDYSKSEIDTVMHNIFTRTCIRHYLKKEVTDSQIIKILDAARQAPSAGNYQPWEFIIVRDPRLKNQIVEASFRNSRRGEAMHGFDSDSEDWMLEAPALIVICINQRLARGVFGERGEKLYGIQSVAAATQNLLLAAHAYGLGTCWVGAFSEDRIAAIVACPKYMRPCSIVTVGWPAEKPKKAKRNELSDIVHVEKFGRTPREKLVRPRQQLF
jgi:nitroreductase